MVWLQSPFAGGYSGAHPPNFGNNVSYAPSRLAFDPSKSGRLYLSCATGLFHTTPLVYSGQPTPAVDWLQQNRNQQGLPVTDIVKVPQQAMRYDNLMVAVKHKAGFVTCGPRTEPVFMIGGPGNVDGFACDYAKDKTAIQYLLAGSGLWRTTNHGADGFAQPPDYLNSLGAVPGIGSKPMMAVQTLSKLVILSETGKKYTTNGAGTWGDCSFRGLSSFSASNGNAHVLVCDPTNGDTYYVLLPDGNGVWKSTNAGATWTRQTSTSPYPSVLPTNYLDGAQMSAVPGQAGHSVHCRWQRLQQGAGALGRWRADMGSGRQHYGSVAGVGGRNQAGRRLPFRVHGRHASKATVTPACSALTTSPATHRTNRHGCAWHVRPPETWIRATNCLLISTPMGRFTSLWVVLVIVGAS